MWKLYKSIETITVVILAVEICMLNVCLTNMKLVPSKRVRSTTQMAICVPGAIPGS